MNDDSTSDNCCAGFCMAPLLIVASLVLLVYNEGNTLAMHRSLDEALDHTTTLTNLARMDASLDGKIVHVVGRAVTTELLEDEVFGVQAEQADPVLKLRRDAVMFQWHESSHEETRTNKDGSETKETVYEYDTVWADHAIDSRNFYDSYGHENPNSMPYPNQVWTAQPITIGVFTLPDVMVNQMDYYQSFDRLLDIRDIPDPYLQQKAIRIREGRGIYVGKDPNYPRIGDEMIWYESVAQQIISFCAVQTGNTFAPYSAQAGKDILLLEPGNHTVVELYEHAHAATTNVAFICRSLGFALLWAGLFALTGPLAYVAEHVPVIGPFLEQGVALVGAAISAVVAMVICGTVIITAWIAYRIAALGFLVWAIPLALVVGGAFGMRHLWAKRRSRQSPYHFQQNNNNLPSAQEAPYQTIPEAKAEIWTEDPNSNSSLPYYVATPVEASAPPAYMDGKGEP
jgi:Transmembrane protein 43